MDLPARWRSDELGRLAHDQDGVVSRAQLRALGVDRFAVRNQVAALRWASPSPRVVVLHRGPLTFRQRCWVAVLHAGDGAVLDGRTALSLAGMTGEPEVLVAVAVPAPRRVPPIPGVRVTQTRSPIVAVGSPPRVRPAEAAVRAARGAPSLAVAGGLLAATAQQRLVAPGALRAALVRLPTEPHRRVLLALLHDVDGGAHALGELGLGAICRRAGLPPPRRQQVRRDRDGRRRWLDAVAVHRPVEIDGIPHLDAVRQTDDCFRQNERVIAGEAVLRFTSLAVRTQPDRVGEQLAAAVARRTPGAA